MKRNANLIFVAAFFIICMIPIGCMGFVSTQMSENRNLSEWPSFSLEDGSFNHEYFNELQTYIAEHFAFRTELVEADSFFKYTLFHSPSDEQVILGKEDWMFFDATLEDYAGATMDTQQIDEIAAKLSDVCEYIEQLGKTPLIMIVPNKNSIYEEYMPMRFGKKAEVTNLTLLQDAMQEKGIPYVDAAFILEEGKKTDEVYLHQDTHWNNTGARLVLNEVYKVFGLENRYELDHYTVEAVHEPDLYKMLFPTQEYYENQHIYQQANDFEYVGRVRSMDDLTIKTSTSQGNGKSILVYRDSFGRAMIPYMGEVFDQCLFNRSTPYDLSLVEQTECDYVLLEIVERNLADLGEIDVP